MEWYVQSRSGGVEHVVMHPTPEAAIAGACQMMDEGGDVFGLGTDSLDGTLDRRETARIYAIWARMTYPLSRNLPESGTHNVLKITLDK
jgi:hypothetical protein